MLEAERAGAKALVAFMDDWPRHSKEWEALRKVQADEAHNCAMVGEMLKRSGATYEFENALPRIGREDVRSLFEGMHRRHRRSIAACEGLLKQA